MTRIAILTPDQMNDEQRAVSPHPRPAASRTAGRSGLISAIPN